MTLFVTCLSALEGILDLERRVSWSWRHWPYTRLSGRTFFRSVVRLTLKNAPFQSLRKNNTYQPTTTMKTCIFVLTSLNDLRKLLGPVVVRNQQTFFSHVIQQTSTSGVKSAQPRINIFAFIVNCFQWISVGKCIINSVSLSVLVFSHTQTTNGKRGLASCQAFDRLVEAVERATL